MSKILALKQDYSNYDLQSPKKTPQKLNLQTPSFSAGVKYAELPKDVQTSFSNGVKSRVDKRIGPLNWMFTKLAEKKGEVQTQIITNIFTCTLAPFVISHNPMTKQDQKTKNYAAWRQPVSAVIALSGTLPLTLLLNNYISKMYSEGYNKTIDLRPVPDKGYLKNLYKHANDKTGKTLDQWSKEFKERRLKTFTTLLSEDPNNISIEDGVIYASDPKTGKKIELERNIPNLSTEPELKAYLDKNNLHRRTMGNFLRDEFHFEFHEDGSLKTEIAKRKISEVMAMDFLRTIGLIDDKVTEADLLRTIMEDRQIKDAPAYAKEHNITEDQAIRAQAILGKQEARSNQMAIGEVLGKSETLSLGQFLHQVGIKLDTTKKDDEKLEDLMKMKMVEGLKKFRAIFSGQKREGGEGTLKGFEKEISLDTFIKRMLERKTGKLHNYSASDKYVVGMVVAAMITAFTCTVLNWVYPRFMERFKPELVGNNSEPKKLPEEKKGGLK